MRIADFLDGAAIEPDLRASSKAGVLRELVGLVIRHHPQLDPNVLVDILLQREKLQSTGIGEGVAIPHGKPGDLPSMVACLGRSRNGVDFQSLDGLPTHLFFLLLVPETRHGLHLKALARVSRLFKRSQVRESLLEAADAASMYEIIVNGDATL